MNIFPVMRKKNLKILSNNISLTTDKTMKRNLQRMANEKSKIYFD